MMDYLKDKGWFRDFVLLALKTGLRRSELINLKWKENVDFKERQLSFRGKGAKIRTVPLPQDAFDILMGRFKGLHENRVFWEIKYPETAWKAFRAMRDIIGIEGTIHDLRHTYATNYIRNRGNVVILQRILGHTDIKTTMRYVHLVAKDLHENIDELTQYA